MLFFFSRVFFNENTLVVMGKCFINSRFLSSCLRNEERRQRVRYSKDIFFVLEASCRHYAASSYPIVIKNIRYDFYLFCIVAGKGGEHVVFMVYPRFESEAILKKVSSSVTTENDADKGEVPLI